MISALKLIAKNAKIYPSFQSFHAFCRSEETRSIDTLMSGLLIHCRVLWSISSAFPDSSPTGTYLYSWVEGGSVRVHPFTPNIYTSTLCTVSYAFPKNMSYESLVFYQRISPYWYFFLLITSLLGNVIILFGEISCWLLL